MTNIEKVKRIIDAGHWVRVTYPENGYIQTVTSYHNNEFSYTDKNPTNIYTVRNPSFKGTIEVIQRIDIFIMRNVRNLNYVFRIM